MAATFSYAQAAKGVAPTQPSKAPSESNTPVSKTDEQSPEIPQTGADVAAPKANGAAEVDNMEVGNEKEVSSPKTEVSGTASPSAGAVASPPTQKEDQDSGAMNDAPDPTSEKRSQTPASGKHSTSAEGPEGKPSEKKKKEKPGPPKELKAAPLPAVNIWQQRKEAQDSKVQASPVTAAKSSKATSETSSVSEDNQDQLKSASKKKGGDSTEKRKGDSVKGQEESAPVPPVEDAALWPTPQGAQGEEKKKAQEKSEKTEKSPVIRSHGKEKWTPVPYVPTAVFSTPLPTAARRGGRSARGGRDTARNGTHGAGASEKTSMQGSTSKQSASGERGRNEPNSTRANSLPAPSRRSNSADNGPTDARKTQMADRTRGPKGSDNANANGKVNGEPFSRKPFPKNHEGFHKGGEFIPKNSHLSVDTQNGQRTGPFNERRFENGPKTADFSALTSDRKDREFIPRAERGRGGHRGRGGGHAGYNGAQTSHFLSNPMAPPGYMHPKSFGYNDRRGPQQNGFANGTRGHPMTMRSPSLPNSASMYNMYPPFSADMNAMYGFQPPQNGPMSAMPYSPYMDSWSVIGMITMQL
jgi:la-related protein 1